MMLLAHILLLARWLIQLTKLKFDAFDAAALGAGGIGGAFAFITNLMDPTLAAAVIGFLSVCLRIGVEIWKIKRKEKQERLQPIQELPNEH